MTMIDSTALKKDTISVNRYRHFKLICHLNTTPPKQLMQPPPLTLPKSFFCLHISHFPPLIELNYTLCMLNRKAPT